MQKVLFLFICLVLLGVQKSSAQQTTDTEQLTELLHQFMKGASNNDRQTHENFWAEDLIYTSSNGTRFGKAQIMVGFENQPEVADSPKTTYTAQEIQIHTYGDVAVVAFKMKGQTGEAVQFYYNSGTFLKRNNRWQVVNWQATKIPQQ
ncbi:MAG: nuclear transport factor 2 family protein [Flavobacteriaceae bacterium]|nr:nuclear transport factor 2 family protein [Flavobacteriaceae bacterium]